MFQNIFITSNEIAAKRGKKTASRTIHIVINKNVDCSRLTRDVNECRCIGRCLCLCLPLLFHFSFGWCLFSSYNIRVEACANFTLFLTVIPVLFYSLFSFSWIFMSIDFLFLVHFSANDFFLLFGFDFSPIFFPSCHLIPVLCPFFPIQFNLRYTNALFVLPAHQCQTKLIAMPCCLTHVFLRVENSSIPFSPNNRIISFPKSLRFAYMLNFAFVSRISQLFVVQIWLDSPRLKYLHRKSIGYVRSEFKSSFCSRS